MKAFLRAVPYVKDALSLPVADVESAAQYYERAFGFQVVDREAEPYPRAILQRDDVRIGVVGNGGDPTQDGCFFEVDDIDAAHAELDANGAKPGKVEPQNMKGTPYRAFFVIAPDGLCYMIAQPER